MLLLRTRDANYRKRKSKPTSCNPVRTTDLDIEPCPTISASGVGASFISEHYIEFDGGQMSEIPKVPRSSKPPQLFDVSEKPEYRVPSMAEIRKIRPNGFTVVSTFAGAGGSSTGYRLAGFKVLWANEFVPIAQESYKANAAPHTIVDGRSIKDVTAEDILAATGLKRGELDVFDGSPPCQAFSTAGKREKGWGTERQYEHGVSQKNEELFFDYIRLRDGLMPRVFVAENVSGLVKGTAKGFFLEILKELKRGYRVTAPLLDAQWLGVPQARQRIVFIGVRDDLGVEPPVISPLPYRYSVRDALPWLGKVVHDTRGSFKSGGTITDRPSVTIMSSAFDAHHFKVQEEPIVTRGNAGGDWKNEGAEVRVDMPAPTIVAGKKGSGSHGFKVTHDTGRKNAQKVDATDRPSPTITASQHSTSHFKVEGAVGFNKHKGTSVDKPMPAVMAGRVVGLVGNSNATHKAKNARHSLEEPAPTVMARRSNLDLEVVRSAKLVTNSQFEEKLVSVDNPSPTIMAGGPGKTSGHVVEVRKINNGDVVGDNVAATLEGYAVGEEYDKLNPGQQSEKFFSLVRADANQPCPTITASGAGGDQKGAPGGIAGVAHPTEKRKFTILEVKRLCSFPDDFDLKGSYGQQWERLGNSVPPVMMQKVAEAIRDAVLIPARAKKTGPRPGSKGRSTKGSSRKGGGKPPPGGSREAARTARDAAESRTLQTPPRPGGRTGEAPAKPGGPSRGGVPRPAGRRRPSPASPGTGRSG